MISHIRANLLLFAATLVLCCVLYPLALWVVGQAIFPAQAEGSLLTSGDGKTVGSRLIAQPFTGKEYFQPRPSAAGNGYDASASGATNWAASNALLRDRVARQLGPIVKYAANSPKKPGESVGPDVEEWFGKQPKDYARTWAKEHPKLAEQWVKDNYEAVADFLKKEPKDVKDNAGENALPFFERYVRETENENTWPTIGEKEVEAGDDKQKAKKKVIEPVKTGEAVQAYFFDLWLRDNKDALLEMVPADMVMTSGSGLDPHITWANAQYQKDGVVDEWTKKTGANRDEAQKVVDKVLGEKVFAPFNHLFGKPMVNVLEVNLEITNRMQPLIAKNKGKAG